MSETTQPIPSTTPEIKVATPPAPEQPPTSPVPTKAEWSTPYRKKSYTWLIIVGIFVVAAIAGSTYLYKPRIAITGNDPLTTITIDGRRIAGTKTSLRISPGEHTISATKTGHVPYLFKGSVSAFSKQKIDLPLRPLPKPKALVSENAFAASFSNDGKDFYYLGNGGKTLFKASVLPSTGDKQSVEVNKITPDILPALKQVIFSPDFSVAIFKKDNGETGLYDFKRYDLLHQEYNVWGSDIGDVVWSIDGKQALYYFAPDSGERSLVISNRPHDQIRRIVNLVGYNITMKANDTQAPQLSWSRDGRLVTMVANRNLYVVHVATGLVTQVAEGNITSATISPDNSHVLYTQNQKLVYRVVKPVDSLSSNTTDQANAGHVLVGEPTEIPLPSDASKAVFSRNNDSVIALSNNNLFEISLTNFTVKPFYLNQPIKNISDVGLASDDQTLYVLAANKLLAVPLDAGNYGK